MAKILLLFLALAFSDYAVADVAGANGNGIIGSTLNLFQTASANWGNKMQTYAVRLFGILALISLVWKFGVLHLQGGGIQEIIAELTKFTATLGLFLYILRNGTSIGTKILQTFGLMAGNAAGFPNTLNPADILDGGFKIFKSVLSQSSIWAPIDSAFAYILSLVIILFLAKVAVDMMLLLVTGYLMIYGGVFFLGFAGAGWTSDIAINYLRSLLALGAQYMGLIFIVGVGKGFVDKTLADMGGGGVQLDQMLIISLATGILAYLAHHIPHMLAAIVKPHGGAGFVGNSSAMASFAAGAAALGVAATALQGAASNFGSGGGDSSGGESPSGSPDSPGGGSFSAGSSQSQLSSGSTGQSAESVASTSKPVVSVSQSGGLSLNSGTGKQSNPVVAKNSLAAAREALGVRNAQV
jgi:type IV secretion system protein TrbL